MKNLMQLHLWIIWKQLVKNLEKYLLSLIEHHNINVVKKYLRKNKDVKLAYLPRGSPHLSMIEEIWRQCKHVNVESEFYESIHEMRYMVMEYFRTHRFNLNMYQYFARTIN